MTFFWVMAGIATVWGGEGAGFGIATVGGVSSIAVAAAMWWDHSSGRRDLGNEPFGRPEPAPP